MQIGIALSPGVTALDAIGPYQVLTDPAGAEVVLCARRAGPLADDVRAATAARIAER
jgi:putative intracellular protease/amidase